MQNNCSLFTVIENTFGKFELFDATRRNREDNDIVQFLDQTDSVTNNNYAACP